ncbi:Uncharacterized protein OBRU01_00391 [Operophtera brumata]|uniref:Uncharacterized protein n=1 Tax=Operophtera brumata TaxID=104452 RepID=A0A0L7LV58_OPEBR|nr:Uncharacterized protein OBRU01_00391 [Operophtera brumata]
MLVNGITEGFPQQCPVVGAFEETGWNTQCPMSNQWSKQLDNVCSVGVYNGNFVNRPVQCHRNDPYVSYVPENVVPQYYHPQNVYHQPRYQPPLIPNLPCHQNQDWDYSSMCYNVDGQPCQYTNVVDLEDFM